MGRDKSDCSKTAPCVLGSSGSSLWFCDRLAFPVSSLTSLARAALYCYKTVSINWKKRKKRSLLARVRVGAQRELRRRHFRTRMPYEPSGKDGIKIEAQRLMEGFHLDRHVHLIPQGRHTFHNGTQNAQPGRTYVHKMNETPIKTGCADLLRILLATFSSS